jgi:hypothetical protein
MKHWWARLYTVPALKKYGLPLSAWALANVFCAIFMPKVREITYFVGMFPLFVFLNNTEHTLANNIDFHRGHMPYKNLRKAVLLDLLLQTMVFILAFWLLGELPWWNVSTNDQVFSVLGTSSMKSLLFLSVVILTAIPKLGHIKRKQEKSLMKLPKDRSKGYLAQLLLLGLVFYLIGVKKMSFFLVIYVLGTSTAVSIFFDWYAENFHSTIKHLESISFAGTCMALYGLIVLTSPMAQREIVDHQLPAEARIHTLLMYKDMDLVIDHHTVSELLNSPSGDTYAHVIFAVATREVFSIDVEQIIKRPNFQTYLAYLKTGRVTARNKEALIKFALEDKRGRSTHHYLAFREAMVKLDPKADILPKRTVASEGVR